MPVWRIFAILPSIHIDMTFVKALIFFVSLACITSVTVAQDKVRIAAASDLKFAMDSVISIFSKTNNGVVDVTYGSSGKLSEQILNGAPFDVFFSADVAYAQHLENVRQTSTPIYRYAKGRIVLWSRKTDPTKTGMTCLTESQIRKIAIANPMHAPYGKRALESFEYYKLSAKIKAKLVYGDNISQAAQFASTGAADAGIIALSLALSPNMAREKGRYFLIPEESHQPLIQGAVITRFGKDQKLAGEFFRFIQGDVAVSILSHFGFTRP
jgi:molybdate transport system substrate-binding protein